MEPNWTLHGCWLDTLGHYQDNTWTLLGLHTLDIMVIQGGFWRSKHWITRNHPFGLHHDKLKNLLNYVLGFQMLIRVLFSGSAVHVLFM